MIYNPDALDFYNTVTTATSPIVLSQKDRSDFFKSMLLTASTLGVEAKTIDANFHDMNDNLAVPFSDSEIYALSKKFRRAYKEL